MSRHTVSRSTIVPFVDAEPQLDPTGPFREDGGRRRLGVIAVVSVIDTPVLVAQT
jgi:hypothetical protein